MKTGIVAVVQARIGSSRLPGKVLMSIAGKPMLQRVVERVQVSNLIENIVLAIPYRSVVLARLATRLGVNCYQGSESDVLDRYYQASEGYHTIVRITGDCPCIDPEIIDGCIQYFLIGGFDFVSNTLSYPDGMDVEVFTRVALGRAWEETANLYDREHVTPYLRGNPKMFKCGEFRHDVDLSHVKVSVDTFEDLKRVRRIYQRLGEFFTLADLGSRN